MDGFKAIVIVERPSDSKRSADVRFTNDLSLTHSAPLRRHLLLCEQTRQAQLLWSLTSR